MENRQEKLLTEREKWCIEKVDFVASVVNDVSREFIWAKIANCRSNKDVSILVQKLLKYDEEDDYSNESAEDVGAVGYTVDKSIQSAAEARFGTPDDNDMEEVRIMEQILNLEEMFPDVDPVLIDRRCRRGKGDPIAYQKFVEELLSEREQPRGTSEQNSYKENSTQKPRRRTRTSEARDFDIRQHQSRGELLPSRTAEPSNIEDPVCEQPRRRTTGYKIREQGSDEEITEKRTPEQDFPWDLFDGPRERIDQRRTAEQNHKDDSSTQSKERTQCEPTSFKQMSENQPQERPRHRRRVIQKQCIEDLDSQSRKARDLNPSEEKSSNQSTCGTHGKDFFIGEMTEQGVRRKEPKYEEYSFDKLPRLKIKKKQNNDQHDVKEKSQDYKSYPRPDYEDALPSSRQQECGICCEDVLASNLVACNTQQNKHRFCRNCVKKFVEEEIGQGRVTFRCIEVDCKGQISTANLKSLVSETVFNSLMKRQQHEELSNAGIQNLLQCPFCDFMMILPDQKDVVFLCQNPECLKDSCRFCREMNHCPQTCEEAKADTQKDVRTMLENRMAEAMIRECLKCKKRFIKEAGCNMMTCACGAKMCYICKQSITGYDHFGTKCNLHSDANAVHVQDVKKAATDAKRDIDPNIKLIHDPTKDVL